jgi:hypothetical protein
MLYLCTPPSLLTQKAPCMRPRIKAKIAPDQKFVTLNHDTKPSVSWIISTVIMNHKIPRVRKLIGAQSIRSNRPKVALTRVSTIHTMIAVRKPSTTTPGTM